MDNAKQHWKILQKLNTDLANRIRSFMVIGKNCEGVLVATEDGKGFWIGTMKFGLSESKTVTEPTPLDVPDLVHMAQSQNHILMLNKQGEIYSMGMNDRGQLGLGSVDEKTHFLPQLISITHKFTFVRCGRWHSLALNEDGKVWAWGWNLFGQVGVLSSTSSVPSPRKISDLVPHRVIAVACGGHHSLALTDQGEVYAWGWNDHGQLGNGSKSSTHNPTRISTPSPVKSLAAGNVHTLLLTQTGEVYACGYNVYGQLGLPNTTETSLLLSKVAGLPLISQIASHPASHLSIAMSSDYRCFVWGHLAIGMSISTPRELTPVYTNVESLLSFSVHRSTPYSITLPEIIDIMKLDAILSTSDLQSIQSSECLSSCSSYQCSSSQSGHPKQTKVMRLYTNSSTATSSVSLKSNSVQGSIESNDEIEIVPKLDSTLVDVDLHSGYCLHSKTLGEGIFGKVRLATHLRTFQNVAVKIVNKKRYRNEQDRLTIDTEIKASKELRHPNIARLLQLIETEEQIYIVREYCPNGDLYDYVDRRDKLEEEEARRIMIDLVNCLDYIHDRGFAHRDIRPENILLDSHCRIKLVGFQFAYMRFGRSSSSSKDFASTKTQYLSPEYVAPEVLNGHKVSTPAIDVWSSGILLHFILTGTLPFTDDSLARLFKKIECGIFTKQESLSADTIDLLERMLTVAPFERITIKEILNHRWIKTHSATTTTTTTTLSSFYIGNGNGIAWNEYWTNNDKLDDNVLEMCYQLHRDDVEDLIELRYNIRYKFGYQSATYWLIKAADYDDRHHNNNDAKLNSNLNAIISLNKKNNNLSSLDNLETTLPQWHRQNGGSGTVKPIVFNQLRRRHTIMESSRPSSSSSSSSSSTRFGLQRKSAATTTTTTTTTTKIDHELSSDNQINKQIVKQQQQQMLLKRNKKFDKSIIRVNKPDTIDSKTTAADFSKAKLCGDIENLPVSKKNFKAFNLSKILLFSNGKLNKQQQQIHSIRSISDHNLTRNTKLHTNSKRSKLNMNSVNDQHHADVAANDSLMNAGEVQVDTKPKKCSLKKSLSRRLSIALPNKFRVGSGRNNMSHINSGSVNGCTVGAAGGRTISGGGGVGVGQEKQQSTSSGIDSVSSYSDLQNDQSNHSSLSSFSTTCSATLPVTYEDEECTSNNYDYNNCHIVSNGSDYTPDDDEASLLDNNNQTIIETTKQTRTKSSTKDRKKKQQQHFSSKEFDSRSSMEIYPTVSSYISSVKLSNTECSSYPTTVSFDEDCVDGQNCHREVTNSNKKKINRNQTRFATLNSPSKSISDSSGDAKCSCTIPATRSGGQKRCSFAGSSSVAIITRFNNCEQCMDLTEELLAQKGINCTRHNISDIGGHNLIDLMTDKDGSIIYSYIFRC